MLIRSARNEVISGILKMPKLLAMVSLYNSGAWIENRIQNLLESYTKDVEIFCVNANSPDIRDHEIPQKYPVRYVKLDERISVYEAWNYAIQNSDSEYITNANTDDIVSPHCYNRMIQFLDFDSAKQTNTDFAYCSWNTTAVENQKWDSLRDIDLNGKPGHYSGDINISGVGHFPMWRRSLHEKLGYFDPTFKALSDADWWARCYHVGKSKFLWINENLATYLWKNGSNLWHQSITSEEWERYFAKLEKYKRGLLE